MILIDKDTHDEAVKEGVLCLLEFIGTGRAEAELVRLIEDACGRGDAMAKCAMQEAAAREPDVRYETALVCAFLERMFLEVRIDK
jgi:hypothetical protein